MARELAAWAATLRPTDADLELARRALVDTVAVAVAATGDPLLEVAAPLGAGGRLAVAAHVRDYDDLHLPSTSHISAVCVPATLAAGGDARAYLAAAGMMARLGSRLGWRHYDRGWHATCTAGAPAAAVAGGIAAGLDAEGLARAMALAAPAAGGNHRAFGTHAKSLQVGFAVDAGLRAAELAAAGATADPAAVDAWLELVGGAPDAWYVPEPASPAIPGGLAIKLHPCCYALQRPIAAVREAVAQHGPIDPATVSSITVTAPEGTLRPLIHDRPGSGLEGKFSVEYAVAAAILDDFPGFASFTDEGVLRPEAQALLRRVDVRTVPGDGDLLIGTVGVQLRTTTGAALTAVIGTPPGAPRRPPTDAELAAKIAGCAGSAAADVAALTWDAGPALVPDLLRPRVAA
ncbi:MAG: MmgE/PrpD family protein [Patulibacter sp.]|nr:MmgE/PrpD family protein [Patulibacter sp.]